MTKSQLSKIKKLGLLRENDKVLFLEDEIKKEMTAPDPFSAMEPGLEKLIPKEGFHILLKDGRSLGPFAKDEVLLKIEKGSVTKNDQILLNDSQAALELDHVPAFGAAIRLFQPYFETTDTKELGSKGVTPILLELYKSEQTGFLHIRRDGKQKILSIVSGRVHEIYSQATDKSNHSNELLELFSYTSGKWSFEENPHVASELDKVKLATPELCRKFAQLAQQLSGRTMPYSNDRPFVAMAKTGKDPAHKDCDQIEQLVLAHAKQESAVSDLLLDLSQKHFAKEEIQRALLFLFNANWITFLPKRSYETKAEEEATHIEIQPISSQTSKSRSTSKWLVPAWIVLLCATASIALWYFKMSSTTLSGFDLQGRFFQLRNAVLVLTALVGGITLSPLSPFAWLSSLLSKPNVFASFWAIAIGAFLGSMIGHEHFLLMEGSALPIYYILGAIICERLLFSAFLGHQIFTRINYGFFATMFVALCFFGYQFSFFSIFALSPQEFIHHLFPIFLGLCVPLAVFQAYTRSVIEPILYHAAFAITAFMISFYGHENWFNQIW